uniref:GG16716 n=1 Tax=Drosophila erecta TaxID=7220 RepID=B3P6Q9_DROER
MQSIHPFLWPSSSPSRWADYDVVAVVVVVGRWPFAVRRSPVSSVLCPLSWRPSVRCKSS